MKVKVCMDSGRVDFETKVNETIAKLEADGKMIEGIKYSMSSIPTDLTRVNHSAMIIYK